jgi:hypothetical protein
MCPVDTNPTPPPQASLPGLPEELCIAIIDECDIPSLIALSQTSRLFNRLIDPFAPSLYWQMRDFLIKSQSFPYAQAIDGFACFICTKVLPRSNFTDKHTRSPYGRLGSLQRLRFCIPCGLETGLFSPGTIIKQKGAPVLVVCRQCGKPKADRFCNICRFCAKCDLAYRRFRYDNRTNGLPRLEHCGKRVGHSMLQDQPGGERRDWWAVSQPPPGRPHPIRKAI